MFSPRASVDRRSFANSNSKSNPPSHNLLRTAIYSHFDVFSVPAPVAELTGRLLDARSSLGFVLGGRPFLFQGVCFVHVRGARPSLSAYRRVICLRRASRDAGQSFFPADALSCLISSGCDPPCRTGTTGWGSPIPPLATGLDPSLIMMSVECLRSDVTSCASRVLPFLAGLGPFRACLPVLMPMLWGLF